MASIKLTGDTSGEITISAPAVAGTNTLTLPAETGSLLTDNISGDFTVDTSTFHVDSTNNISQLNTNNETFTIVNIHFTCIPYQFDIFVGFIVLLIRTILIQIQVPLKANTHSVPAFLILMTNCINL